MFFDICSHLHKEGNKMLDINTSTIYSKLPQVLSDFKKELDGLLDELNLDSFVNTNIIREQAMNLVYEDLVAYVKEDPSLSGNDDVASKAKGFEAVRYYRYLNTAYKVFLSDCDISLDDDEHIKTMVFTKIRYYSENTKRNTNVEIHPFSTIGKRFIIDHGTGTVIGEKTKIGDDCMILNDVVLGSSFDKNVAVEDRHPKIGNNVKIYSGARVLGNIVIGDNCIIGTKCIVKKNLPPNSRVSVINQLQITKKYNTQKCIIYGVVPSGDNSITVYGKNLICDETLRVEAISNDLYETISDINMNIVEKTENIIKVLITSENKLNNYGIKIYNETNEIIIKDCTCLSEIGG